jgi:prolyl-tRNA editing enzyme YbaK/EbsC (Cys-tRNA(Pro) deacylase)
VTSTPPHPAPRQLRGFPAVRRALDENGVDYEIVRHDPTGGALAEARAYGAPPRRVVKTVAVRCGGRLVAVAIPASSQLQMHRVRHLLDDPDAHLASEAELAHELPGLEVGALPPFGAPAPPLVLVDRRLLASNWVLANGGDHRHSLRVSPLQIVRLSQARVVDISGS